MRKLYTSLAVEEVRLLDDNPRLFGTVLQFVLERYDVPERYDRCQSPTTGVMHQLPT